uniref:Proteasome activator complex subunit 3 n=1 Tax=Steinernema glaseri TaxID=37863 RepID=A0A1I8A5G0_9BILA
MTSTKSATNGGTDYNKKLADYKKNLLVQAEKIVLEEFPKRVIQFNELLEDEQFSYELLSSYLPDLEFNLPRPEVPVVADDAGPPKKRKCVEQNGELITEENGVAGTPIYGFVNGPVKCNKKLADLTDLVRPLLRNAVEDVNKVKMWILFLIPRIEDGNNFGVSIQEETLSEVRTVESEAASFLDQMSRYFVSRARLVTKVAKYPHVDDYRRAIIDLDEKQFINIRLVLTEMRNHFATLHDMITKNLEKIKTPRSSNHDHMY